MWLAPISLASPEQQVPFQTSGVSWVKWQQHGNVQDVCGEGLVLRVFVVVTSLLGRWQALGLHFISRIVWKLVGIKKFNMGSNKDFRHSLVLQYKLPIIVRSKVSWTHVKVGVACIWGPWRQMLSACSCSSSHGGIVCDPWCLLLGLPPVALPTSACACHVIMTWASLSVADFGWTKHLNICY